MRDLFNNIDPASSIAAQAVTATVNGAGVNLQGYNGADFLVDLGTFAGTTPTATIKFQESDDNTTFTDVAATDLLNGANSIAVDTTNDAQVHRRGYVGKKQYVRVIVSAIAGTTPSLPMSATVVRAHGRHKGGEAV